jgi:hypothetical protein
MVRMPKFLPQLFLAMLLCACQKPATADRSTASQSNPDELALRFLSSVVRSDNLYPDIKSEQCLVYEIERHDTSIYEIAVRENHVSGCGGDPNTSPVRDRFKVSRDSEAIQIYDVTSGAYVPYQHKRPSTGG